MPEAQPKYETNVDQFIIIQVVNAIEMANKFLMLNDPMSSLQELNLAWELLPPAIRGAALPTLPAEEIGAKIEKMTENADGIDTTTLNRMQDLEAEKLTYAYVERLVGLLEEKNIYLGKTGGFMETSKGKAKEQPPTTAMPGTLARERT